MASSKRPLTIRELDGFEITSGQGFGATARFAMRYFDQGCVAEVLAEDAGAMK